MKTEEIRSNSCKSNQHAIGGDHYAAEESMLFSKQATGRPSDFLQAQLKRTVILSPERQKLAAAAANITQHRPMVAFLWDFSTL